MRQRLRLRLRLGLAAVLGCLAGPVPACELALALAVDVSGSVDRREFALQMTGLAQALRDPRVVDALIAEKAHVTLIQWSGTTRQRVSIPWTPVRTAAQAETLARAVGDTGRSWRNFSTGIGEAMLFAANHFAAVPACKRKVIDISGDGISNEGVSPAGLRTALAAAGFQINALAIETDDRTLARYYRDNVIAGPNAFVIGATGFDDYPEKIRRKLLREVTKQIATR